MHQSAPFLLYNFDPTKTFFCDDDKKGSKKPFGSPATYDSYVSARRTFFKNELGKRGFDVTVTKRWFRMHVARVGQLTTRGPPFEGRLDVSGLVWDRSAAKAGEDDFPSSGGSNGDDFGADDY